MTRLYIPEPGGPVFARGEDRAGVEPGGQAPDPPGVAEMNLLDFPRGDIRELDNRVNAGPCEEPVVAGERNRVDPVDLRGKFVKESAGGPVPD